MSTSQLEGLLGLVAYLSFGSAYTSWSMGSMREFIKEGTRKYPSLDAAPTGVLAAGAAVFYVFLTIIWPLDAAKDVWSYTKDACRRVLRRVRR